MKTFLGNAPWHDEKHPDKYGVRAGSRWPHFQIKEPGKNIGCYVPFPHFLASSAAVLEEAGQKVFLIDGVAEQMDIEEFIHRIEKYGPDLVLLEVSTPSIAYDIDVAQKIKSVCPEVKIAFCGIHAPMYGKGFLEKHKYVDFILFGEYEYTLKELVANYNNGNSYGNIKGLIFRKPNGEVAVNERRSLIEPLDQLPFYAYHFLPMKNYRDTPCGLPSPSVQMWTSRGCPFHCSFCAWPQIIYGGHQYRTRSIPRVLDELELLIKEYGFRSFYFDDDTVNIGKKRMLELCSEIQKRGIKLPWAIMARADTMDAELLTAFKEAGLYSLKYGVESGDQELVNRSGKKLDLAKTREMVAMTKNLGIKVHLTFAFGLPGETSETIQKTTDFALELDPDSVQFSLVTPFPGSRLYEMALEKGWLVSKDWSRYNGSSSSVVRTENLSATDLEEALNRAHKRWTHHLRKKDYQPIYDKIRKKSGEYLRKTGKTLLLRSSFLAHFESVLDLVTKGNGYKASVLGQSALKEILDGDPRVEDLFIYGDGFLKDTPPYREMTDKIIQKKFDTVIILYNDFSRETYREVEEIAKSFNPGKILGIDTEGCSWELQP